jgi:PKD repeat protein
LAWWLIGLAIAASGCDIATQSPPSSLTGPSELGLSLTLSANPSLLTQDGFSWTRVDVLARDANAQPLANIPMRAEILINGALADFGQLSTRTVVTGNDGRGSVVYTAPPPPQESVDFYTTVTLLFTPLDPNYANALPRSLQVRVVPPGVLLPPNGAPTADFTFSQPAEQGNPILFDASASTDLDGTIVAYAWDFGDGTTNTGQTVQHTYSRGGTFTVILTVTDDRGQSATTTQQVTVSASADPTASFAISPTSPSIGEQVTFNAAASQAAAGRQIVSYAWTFGDGGTASGAQATHTYSAPGTYSVVLTVTDDIGSTGTTSNTVLVQALLRPTASFAVSPSTPAVGELVSFNASASQAAVGRQIVRYSWTFGDGSSGSGALESHTYNAPGTYIVVLTVTDDAGNTGTATNNVSVGNPSRPTASFVFSPTDPAPGVVVRFDASASTAPAGRFITSYQWTFGDGGVATGQAVDHPFAAELTYTVVLTVTDSAGQTGVTTQTVTVAVPAP